MLEAKIRLRILARYVQILGFNPKIFLGTIIGIPGYLYDYIKFRKQTGNRKDFETGPFYPMLNDKKGESGIMKGHYFHQDLLVAQMIFKNNPVKHVDIGSRTDGFVAHIAVFREIELFDIREQHSKVKNIIFKRADLTNLPKELINYCDSLSSLHVIEHFGLGRYGDRIEWNGHLHALENIGLILKAGGKFYFSVPIGKQRVEFNAHRVFGLAYLIDVLEKNFFIDSFSYVDDNGDLTVNAALKEEDISRNFGCYYGCGIFELTKKQSL